MTLVLKGKPVADALLTAARVRVQALKDRGIVPSLALIRLGEEAGDCFYERAIIKKMESIGGAVTSIHMRRNIPQEELINTLKDCSDDAAIHGILLLRPLPQHLPAETVENAINPLKDVDGMCDISLARLMRGRAGANVACTAQAVVHLLDYYHFELTGARVVIIGRSLTVSKPLAFLLMNRNATVSVAHSKTLKLKHLTREADIVVSCMGKPHMLTSDYFQEEAAVIDVGTSSNEAGEIVGDVCFDDVQDHVQAITPVPGGVGSITTACLCDAVVTCAETITFPLQ